MIASAIQQIVNTDRAELKDFEEFGAGLGFGLGFRIGIGFRLGIVLVDVGYLDIATA
jgi:hypothetical protein